MLGVGDGQSQYLVGDGEAEEGFSGSSSAWKSGCLWAAQLLPPAPSSLRKPSRGPSTLATVSAGPCSPHCLPVQPGLCSPHQGQSLLFSGTTSTSRTGRTGAASPSRQLCTKMAALYSATKR